MEGMNEPERGREPDELGMVGWTPSCPGPDEILGFAESGPAYPDAHRIRIHLESCRFCQKSFEDTSAVLALTGANPRAAGDRRADTALKETIARGSSGAFKLAFAGFAAGAALAALIIYGTAIRGLRVDTGLLVDQLHEARLQSVERAKEKAALSERLKEAEERAALKPGQTEASADAKLLEEAVLLGRLVVPREVFALSSLTRGSGVSDVGTILLASPVGTFVLDDQPVLRVARAKDFRELKAVLTDTDGSEIQLKELSPSTWKPVGPLKRNQAYQWFAVDGTGLRSMVATFEVVDKDIGGEAARARERNRSNPLVMAAVYARYGLLDEAERAVEQVLKDHARHQVAESFRKSILRARQGGGP